MQSRGPLMIEHRLIERMIAFIRTAAETIERTGQTDPSIIDSAVDFIRTYADATHHGKEEEMYFKVLAGKQMTAEDRRLMEELVQEHVFGRQVTRDLVAANARHRKGDEAALPVIIDKLRTIAGFYPTHIEKEDKNFFPAAQRYLSRSEDQALLSDFREFDGRMIHVKYTQMMETLEMSRA